MASENPKTPQISFVDWLLIAFALFALVCIAACRGPDSVEVGGSYGTYDGTTDTHRERNFDSSGDAQAVALTFGWDIGRRAEYQNAMQRWAERRDTITPINIVTPPAEPEPPPDDSSWMSRVPWEAYVAAVIFLAGGGAWAEKRRRARKKEDADPE